MIVLSITKLTIIGSVLLSLLLIISLVIMLLFTKAKLSPSGKLKININGEKEIEGDGGDSLLTTLSNSGIFLPSACGGGGTCIQCTCQVHSGGGGILPTEEPHFTRKEIASNYRLGCQVKVKNDLDIKVPDEVFSIKKFECEVISNHNVATFIKELRLKLPDGLDIDFRAGGYIQIYIPEYKLSYKEFDEEL